MGRRTIDQKAAKASVVAKRRAGETLVEAATAAGVHVATVCRWKNTDSRFAAAIRKAEEAVTREIRKNDKKRLEEYLAKREAAEQERYVRRLFREQLRNCAVPTNPYCPRFGALSEIRKALWWIPFWRCSRYPWCSWASWRPRYPRNCSTCRGPMYWSEIRLSFSCPRCKVRHEVEWL
jgi:hypothetical protein